MAISQARVQRRDDRDFHFARRVSTHARRPL
jgi:hypothetical protein